MYSEIKGRVEKQMQTRLKMYDADDIQLSRGTNPRTLIKNAIIGYNGYYQLDFNSKKDKSHYTCKLTYATNMDIEAKPYLMDCKSDKDSSIFPTHLNKLFAAQFPDSDADQLQIDRHPLSNSMSTLMLTDSYEYDVTYRSKATGALIRCDTSLEMSQSPNSPSDQKFFINKCKTLQAKRPEYKKIVEDGCDPALVQIINMNVLLNDLYSDSDKWLQNIKPLPKKEDVACDNKDPNYWKKFGDQMISLNFIRTGSYEKAPEGLEKMVLENTLINQAYNRLYVKSRNFSENKNADSLQWLSVAAHSSPIVGKTLRAAHAENIENNNYLKPGLQQVINTDKEFMESAGGLAEALSKRAQVATMVHQGNVNIFKDMYWQNFAAAYCGPGKTRELLKDLKEKAVQTKDKKSEEHLTTLENAWAQIENGSKANPVNEQMIKSGNMQLLWAEQHDILQDHMYGTNEAKLVSKMGIFNNLAKTNFSDPQGKKIPGFSAYCRENKIECDLGNFDSRFSWMKEVVSDQLDYIKSANGRGTLKTAFYPTLQESKEILSDYSFDAFMGFGNIPSGFAGSIPPLAPSPPPP